MLKLEDGDGASSSNANVRRWNRFSVFGAPPSAEGADVNQDLSSVPNLFQRHSGKGANKDLCGVCGVVVPKKADVLQLQKESSLLFPRKILHVKGSVRNLFSALPFQMCGLETATTLWFLGMRRVLYGDVPVRNDVPMAEMPLPFLFPSFEHAQCAQFGWQGPTFMRPLLLPICSAFRFSIMALRVLLHLSSFGK